MGRRGARSDLARLIAVAVRRPLLGRRRRSVVLVIGLVAIAAWQAAFFRACGSLDDRWALISTGLNQDSRFVYFFYYLGLFPVTSDGGHLLFLREPGYERFSRKGAERVLRESGDTLLMEWGQTIRNGEPGKMFLYLPDALLKGAPRPPLSTRPLHGVMFVVGLLAVFGAFWWARLPLLGALLTALAGSDPFQLLEVYGRDNVFGWPITTGLLVLALAVPLLRNSPSRGVWRALPPLATGALVGTIALVRSEPVTVLAAAGMACVTLARASWARRLCMLLALIGSFLLTRAAWSTWFQYKFQEARSVVAAAGGHPYDGPRAVGHYFWHPMWCGLGDFGADRGYAWSDQAAGSYAYPVLKSRYPEWELAWRGKHGPEVVSWSPTGAFWDVSERYPKTPYEVPHYADVLREKVLGDVAGDPLWYLRVLAKRAWRVLRETTPVRLALGTHSLTLPWSGLMLLPLAAALALARGWTLLKLTLFPLATSLPALLIYSGDGVTNYSWYHLAAAAVAAGVALDVAAAWAYRRLRRLR